MSIRSFDGDTRMLRSQHSSNLFFEDGKPTWLQRRRRETPGVALSGKGETICPAGLQRARFHGSQDMEEKLVGVEVGWISTTCSNGTRESTLSVV